MLLMLRELGMIGGGGLVGGSSVLKREGTRGHVVFGRISQSLGQRNRERFIVD